MAKDFRKKTFSKILRGYSPEEVDEYIAYVNEEYQKLARRNSENERKLTLAAKKLTELQKAEAESTVSGISGDVSAESIIREAEKRRDAILAEAAAEAGSITQAAADEAKRILDEAENEASEAARKAALEAEAKAKAEAAGVYKAASDMYDEICAFRDSLFSIYNTHIESIESLTESAKSYIDRTDRLYSDATGAAVSHTEDDDEDEYGDGYDHDRDMSDEADETEEEQVTEIPDEASDSEGRHDLYIELDEDEDEGFSYDDPEDESFEDILQIDWKKRIAVDAQTAAEAEEADETRVLDLRTIREAAAAEASGVSDRESEDFFDGELSEDGINGIDYSLSREAEYDDSGDFEEVSDFDEELENEFKEMDSLFSEDKSGRDFSLTDEFDIVFAQADSKKNVDEIRKQPIVTPEEPQKKKKHMKF